MSDTQVADSVRRNSIDLSRESDNVNFDFFTRKITQDLRCFHSICGHFHAYKKEDVMRFLANPEYYEDELRRVIMFVYIVSPHFRRLIQYFTGLSDLSYYVAPYQIDTRKENVNMMNTNYRKLISFLSKMSIKTQFPKILTVCLREDTFFGTIWIDQNSITIQPLPSKYCRISSIEENVCNVAFDFRFFDRNRGELSNYPTEFAEKYEEYRNGDGNGKAHPHWIELDSPTSFAIKCNTDILRYSIPPFAGILPEIFDIDTYKQMKMDKTDMENYAMLSMKIPLVNGEWGIDLNKAEQFWRNLDSVLPDRIGSVLTPMDIEKISFEKSGASDADTVAEAEQNLFTAAGVSSLLFNNEKASSSALLLSIKADQMITYGIVKSIQDMVNRLIHKQSFGKKFEVTFLDCSPYNRKEVGDALLKAFTYGLPTISMYAASQGLEQSVLDGMSFLETKVLGLQDMFKPLLNSAQISSSDSAEVGAPEKDIGELTDSGEQSREDGDDWG